ncbi:MAG: GspE/PulE family protein [Pseudomonadota bacterium]
MKTLPDNPVVSRRAGRLSARVGELLVSEGVITPQALDAALAVSATTGKRLGRVLVQSGAISEDKLALLLSKQLGVPFVNLSQYEFQPELVKLLPEATARRCLAVVLENKGTSLLVGLADPGDVNALDDIERVLKRVISPAACPESQILTTLDRVYRRTDEITGHAIALGKDIGESVSSSQTAADGKEEAPVVRLLQSLLEDAIQVRASDVHIEPQERTLQIRFRIDGVLQPQAEADVRITGALTQRLKLMANLDIAERRLPMDGRFSVKARNREIDVRMSTLPGQFGESIVLRLLDQSGAMRGLDAIGMPLMLVTRLREILNSGSGMVLVTGPTGAGKTTTLYAALSEVDVATQKVITVEDPVEYRLPGIVQVQVNDKIELTFARVLRATLRQDPDVVLVGEMRDTETVEIGLRAALTGHMVLSSLHTRDAPSAVFRLLDMEAPPYMVATCLRAVVAQRLCRLNCTSCSSVHPPTVQERAWLSLIGGDEGTRMTVQRGTGCQQCGGGGYRNRTGIYEMFVMDETLAKATIDGGGAAFLTAARARMRGKTLADHAFALVREGRTSVAEAMRVASVGED